MTRTKKRFVLLASLLFSIPMGLTGCIQKVETPNPIVTMELESGGKVVIELYRELAPNTVANFVSLAQEGYYDGLTFHRVFPGAMVQGGCPEGTGRGGPGYNIAGEFAANKFTKNNLAHTRGVISMARAGDTTSGFDTAGSQFFICLTEVSGWNGQYAAFGMVTEGIEYLEEISNLPSSSDLLIEQPVVKAVTVETFGATYTVKKV